MTGHAVVIAGGGPTGLMIAEAEMDREPELGLRRDEKGLHGLSWTEDGTRVRVMVPDPRTGESGGLDITPWADRVRLVDAGYAGPWELPVLGEVPAPAAVLIRPDGYVAWAGDPHHPGLHDALTAWFGPPAEA